MEEVPDIRPHQVSDAFAEDRLRLMLLPTEQCNFRCTYCYEDFKHGQMSPEIISGVKSLIERRSPTLRHLHLSWFGGEPLSALNVILDIMKTANIEKNSFGYNIDGDMSTNAYRLNPKVLADLCDSGVNYFQVALDGPKAIHDKTRVRINGRGTFDLIWRNLMSAKQSTQDFHIALRLHVTADNYQSWPTLLEDIRTELLDDSRFSARFEFVGRWGGPNDTTFEPIKEKDRDKILNDLMDAIGMRDEDRTPKSAYICYAAKPNNFIIRSDGRVQKCTVILEHDANSIGQLQSDGSLLVDSKKMMHWMKGWSSSNAGVLGCPMLLAKRSFAKASAQAS